MRTRRADEEGGTVEIDRACFCPGSADVPVRHLAGAPRPLLRVLLLRTPFQEVVHGQRIEPQLGFQRFVLG